MDAGNQQRILGYFIEEAKEHLDTLEKGILELRVVVKDPERVNEMFRAAHSVKGGAAMLGFESIQKTSHRLEDSFKILKEHEINVDRKLETLFLKGYDTLKDLIEQLQGPFGLREEEATKTMQAADPHFAQLQAYLNQVVRGGGDSSPVTATTATVEKAQGKVSSNFASQVMEVLKQMLPLFKQGETQASRQKLLAYCKRLAQLGAGIEAWQKLLQVSYKAIANPKNSFQTLAPVVIKELKQASDGLQAGKGNALAASPALQQLAGVATAATPAESTPSSQKEKPTAATATSATPKQITLTVEPKAAAKAIIQAFDKPQLVQLVKLLAQAARTPS
ncbi:MAG TPA: Hpt domain-containing protein [Candidatus Sericytochromatia bacterium]